MFLNPGQGLAGFLLFTDELDPLQDGVIEIYDLLIHGHRLGQQTRIAPPPGDEYLALVYAAELNVSLGYDR